MKTETRGRKKLFPDGKKFNVFLDEATMRKAQKIGGGFISRGLRRAVAEWPYLGTESAKS